jgi:hypothetical protein
MSVGSAAWRRSKDVVTETNAIASRIARLSRKLNEPIISVFRPSFFGFCVRGDIKNTVPAFGEGCDKDGSGEPSHGKFFGRELMFYAGVEGSSWFAKN